MYKGRSLELREYLKIHKAYVVALIKSGHEVPEVLRDLIADQTAEYHGVRYSRFCSYLKYEGSYVKYEESKISVKTFEGTKKLSS